MSGFSLSGLMKNSTAKVALILNIIIGIREDTDWVVPFVMVRKGDW